MSKKLLAILAIIIPILIITGLIIYASKLDLAILNPSGEIAARQHELLSFAFWLSMVVILPVFGLILFISIKYREGKQSKYSPDWAHNNKLEATWWGIPIVIIIILSLVTWRTSHTLDPYKPLDNARKPLEVQVVSLQWKWLFLYPEQGIATVNYLKIPENTPINFEITSDAPMNSFWIPKLGGQVYAMSGMSTKLHLIANEKGIFNGSSANISGEGFADMRFTVESVSNADFQVWASNTSHINTDLDIGAYEFLTYPSPQEEPLTFSRFEPNLFKSIINKYMLHDETNNHIESSGH